ncbi:MFS transporter [Polaromonas sp.]|nr:MFS transporter [Polaromonas sp.]
MSVLRRIPVATIVVAQLFGTSLWFSPNSAADDLVRAWSLSLPQWGQLTSVVQVGFIVGTLLLATSGLADRFSASRIFAISCVLGAFFNAVFALAPVGFEQALLLRFTVGVCLAGIYPLGMKMVIAWSKDSTGNTLGLLVAMLTLGTSLPHAIRAAGGDLSWQGTVLASSVLALAGAAAVFLLGDGPYLQRAAARRTVRWGEAFMVFKNPAFRASALGYFGHMWELYAFWTVVPFLVRSAVQHSDIVASAQPRLVSMLSFVVIAVGAIGCILAGKLSKRFGSPRVAAAALAVSGTMCFLYPLVSQAGLALCVVALVVWGMSVIADSAQFSAIAAKTCPPETVGSALAIQNSVGFFVTVLSITLVTSCMEQMGTAVAWLLLPGPVIGLLFFRPFLTRQHVD